MFRFRHQINTTFVPRITAPDAANGEPAAFQCTVLFHSFFGVVRAARIKAAVIAQHGADKQLIAANDQDEQMFHAGFLPPVIGIAAQW